MKEETILYSFCVLYRYNYETFSSLLQPQFGTNTQYQEQGSTINILSFTQSVSSSLNHGCRLFELNFSAHYYILYKIFSLYLLQILLLKILQSMLYCNISFFLSYMSVFLSVIACLIVCFSISLFACFLYVNLLGQFCPWFVYTIFSSAAIQFIKRIASKSQIWFIFCSTRLVGMVLVLEGRSEHAVQGDGTCI